MDGYLEQKNENGHQRDQRGGGKKKGRQIFKLQM